jgi:hypothetical protein
MQTITMPKERPILFSSHMVKAILDGRKTQTRRILKTQPRFDVAHSERWIINGELQRRDSGIPLWIFKDKHQLESELSYEWGCPYGDIGELLWVRETWLKYLDLYLYRATDPIPDSLMQQEETKWKPSIHMPRCASRIKLKIQGVSVERVEDCSTEDAIAEGFGSFSEFINFFYQLNPSFYTQNPYVWVIQFEMA